MTRGRTVAAIVGVAGVIAAAAGVALRARPGPPDEPPPASLLTACSPCHAFAPPASLPKARWRQIIPEMASMPLEEGMRPLAPEQIEEALAWYEARAPERLPPPPPNPTGAPEHGEVAFTAEHLVPRAQHLAGVVPQVANVRFVPFLDPTRPDLLLTEQRSGTLLHLSPWAPPEHRFLHPIAKRLKAPCRVHPADVDGDGHGDLVVSSLGGLAPSNEEAGAVFVLHRVSAGKVLAHEVAAGLGRACDARGADLDGDGDADLAVAAFGWRGPGRLLVLENVGRGARFAFEPRVLDERDGFIDVAPVDIDGDGRLELVALLSQHHEQVVVFDAPDPAAPLAMTARTIHHAPHPAWGYSGMQVVDLDGDGDRDVLLSNGDALDDALIKPDHGVAWLRNEGAGAFTHHRIAFMPGCERAVAGDIDGDGDLDVVAVAYLPQLPPRVWRENDLASVVWIEQRAPDDWRVHPIERHVCHHPTADLADLDGDGRLDIAVGNAIWLTAEGPVSEGAFVTLFTRRP